MFTSFYEVFALHAIEVHPLSQRVHINSFVWILIYYILLNSYDDDILYNKIQATFFSHRVQ